MAIQTATMRTALAAAYATNAPYAALYSTVPGASAGTELAGGSPAYARQAANWGTAASSAVSAAPAAFNVASGATVAGAGFHSASTGGSYLDGGAVTSQAFASQGTYTLTATYTQS
jgi:hypothetical protein